MSAESLVHEVDALYASVVTDPRRWGEQAYSDWTEAVGPMADGNRDAQRWLRKALRMAQRLQAFWAARIDAVESDWRSRVDMAAGAAAWRPSLELARLALEERPTEDAFREVQERFRLVHNRPWLEGLAFEEWSADREV